MICQTAGNADMAGTVPPERLDEIGWLAMLADGVDECRRAARTMIRQGADLIKICTSGGGGSVRGGPHEVQFTLDEVRAFVDEAHRAGRKVASHSHGLDSVRLALDGGVDTIEHGTYADDECFRRMAAEGKPLVATIVNIRAFAEQGEQHGVPEAMLRKAREDLKYKGESLMRAYEQGVTIVHGSDSGGAPPARHGINAGNLTVFVEAGLPPFQALRAATANAAEALGLADDLGTVETGKLADLLVVDGNPLEEISLLEDQTRILAVFKGGELLVDRRP
jgi:imidazolonepropionase-like amidohydrolase